MQAVNAQPVILEPNMKQRTRKHDGSRRASDKSKTGLTTLGVLGPGFARTGGVKSINPKWAWHYRVLLALRDRLLEERGERRTEVAQPLEPHSLDIADSATDEFDHDLALAELSAEQDALYEVDEALKRILNGSYGVCQETGKPIPAARLRAIPWTRFGKEVEVRLENKGLISKPHLGTLGSVRAELTGDLEESEYEEEKQPPVPEDETLRQVLSPPREAARQRLVSSRQRSRDGRARRRGRSARSRQRPRRRNYELP
jgi:RNA polymerase-binding transcription factor DksA